MKRRMIILFGVIIILLAVIIVVNKKITESKEVLGKKLSSIKSQVASDKTEEDEKRENEDIEEMEASTTQDNFKDRNIEYSILNINQGDGKADIKSDTSHVIDYSNKKNYFLVTKVVDGDTIDVMTGTTTERVRLIGINTPETVDPRKAVECFGKEASAKAHEFLENKKVYLEADKTQDNRDKYGRLLRYIRREDGLFYNLEIIKLGYAYEYTYQIPYKYQTDFKAAQVYAKENKLGLWADNACATVNGAKISTSTTGALPLDSNCVIKGNIASDGEKIYHLPVCAYYAKTIINLSQGEKYFCTESEAQAAGWRKAQNCE
jgi:micrococcal nuclease